MHGCQTEKQKRLVSSEFSFFFFHESTSYIVWTNMGRTGSKEYKHKQQRKKFGQIECIISSWSKRMVRIILLFHFFVVAVVPILFCSGFLYA